MSGIKDEYEKLLVNRNKEVYIIEGDSRIKRVAIGIDTDGELLVKDDNGNIEKIMAGEVKRHLWLCLGELLNERRFRCIMCRKLLR